MTKTNEEKLAHRQKQIEAYKKLKEKVADYPILKLGIDGLASTMLKGARNGDVSLLGVGRQEEADMLATLATLLIFEGADPDTVACMCSGPFTALLSFLPEES